MGSLSEIKKMADRPLNELLTRDMVDIYVGPLSTHWILHEKLLCARSLFFRRAFYTSHKRSSTSSSQTSQISKEKSTSIQDPKASPSTDTSSPAEKSLGLPDDDDSAFTTFVAWLYSSTIPYPRTESDLTPLFELYLMGARWGMPTLTSQTLDAVRSWYADTDTYPGLRRVQYVYANTSADDAMRRLLVSSVARGVVLGEGKMRGSEGGLPAHWDKALRKNGQLAVDLMMEVRGWSLKPSDVPDARKGETKKEDDQEDDEENVNVKEEKSEEGAAFNMKALDKELPNGLVNGHRE